LNRLQVLASGMLTTVQDLGRFGYAQYGISASGAADALALRAGNLLVGNAENAAALEMTLDSPLVPGSADFAAYAAPSFPPARPLLEGARDLTHRIHGDFQYDKAATDVSTPVAEVMRRRHGVCQDFAHVLIGACRSLGLAARYVSGYLLTQPPPGTPRLVGADASHAWAAVWCPPHGWLALDPTNDVPVGQDHVTLAWGRDYADVAPLRGVIRGGSGNAPRVAVTVEPL